MRILLLIPFLISCSYAGKFEPYPCQKTCVDTNQIYVSEKDNHICECREKEDPLKSQF